MNPGRWVFPFAIFCFFLVLIGYVSSNPATPAPGDPTKRLLRVMPGDNVTVEMTQYYDVDHEYVAHTTRAEVYERIRDEMPFPVGFTAQPLDVLVPERFTRSTDHPIASLLGHKIGDSITSPKFPELYGAWSQTRDISILLVKSERHFSLNETRYVLFVQAGQARLGHEPQAGDVFACQPRLPLPCRVDAIDPEGRTLNYTLDVHEGDTIPLTDVVGFTEVFTRGTPVPTSPFGIRNVGDATFDLYWKLEPGDAFALGDEVVDWIPGSYLVESVTGDTATIRFRPHPTTEEAIQPAHLVGETIWFDFTIVDIERP